MPRWRKSWESEYTDPTSEAEDVRLAEIGQQQNEEIMRDIFLCMEEEEDEQRRSILCDSRVEDVAFYDDDDGEDYRDSQS
jgi:hypothetical protein